MLSIKNYHDEVDRLISKLYLYDNNDSEELSEWCTQFTEIKHYALLSILAQNLILKWYHKSPEHLQIHHRIWSMQTGRVFKNASNWYDKMNLEERLRIKYHEEADNIQWRRSDWVTKSIHANEDDDFEQLS